MVELVLPWLVSVVSCVCVVVVAYRAHRRSFRQVTAVAQVPDSDAEQVAAAVHGSQRVMAWAGGAGLAVVVVSAIGVSIVGAGANGLSEWLRYTPTAPPPMSGPLLVFAPLAGAAVFAAVVALRPAARWSGTRNRREADLRADDPHDLSRLLAGCAAAAIALLILTVLVGTAVQHTYPGNPPALTVSLAGTTDQIPYPGWGHVLAVTVAVFVVVGVVVAAVMRVRTAAGPGLVRLTEVDRAVRSWQSGLIVLAGTTATVLGLGITAWAVGDSYVTISRFPVVGDCRSTGTHSSICREVGAHYAQPAFAIGVTEVLSGVILVAISFILMLLIARRIRRGISLRITSSTDQVPV